MGFNPTRYAQLIFEDPDWEGAEVRVKLAIKMSTYLEARQRQFAEESDTMENWVKLLEEILVSWNLEDDDGNPIPATPEGIRHVPTDFLGACAAAWRQAVGQVEPPLEPASSNGNGSGEASMPTETLLPDLSSLSTPN